MPDIVLPTTPPAPRPDPAKSLDQEAADYAAEQADLAARAKRLTDHRKALRDKYQKFVDDMKAVFPDDGGNPIPLPGPAPAPAPPPPPPTPPPAPTPGPRPPAPVHVVNPTPAPPPWSHWLPSVLLGMIFCLNAVHYMNAGPPAPPAPVVPSPVKPTPPPTPPAPASPASALGRAFRAPLAKSLAQGGRAFDTALAAGLSVAEADKALKETGDAARKAAFAASVGPALSKILPDGTEPKDDAQRDAVRQFWRDFAAGLETPIP